MSNETVGKVARDLLLKDEPSHSVVDVQREVHKKYEENIAEAIVRGKKDYPNNFYVIVVTKKERLMHNVLRNYFTCRISCPTPEFDQTVYHYDRKGDHLEFLWVVPAKDVCEYYRINALQVADEEKELLGFVLDFYEGALDRKSKIRNGELKDSPELEKKG